MWYGEITGMSKTLVSKCHGIHQLQYLQRKLDVMIYPICDWDADSYTTLNRALNESYARHIPCLYDHVEVTSEFKQLVRDHINTSLKQFLGWHDFITILPYYASEHIDISETDSKKIEFVEYPTIDSYTVRDVWYWAKFNISQLNWIHFLTFYVKKETNVNLNFDKIYNDRNTTYAKLISIANIIGDSELIKYSTDAHLKTFCIKQKASVSYAVMQLFSSFENGFGGYETKNRQIFEDELYRLYTNFMEK